MNLSPHILALWVFLVASVTQLGWFGIDLRFIGFVGVVYVIVWMFEAAKGSLLPARR